MFGFLRKKSPFEKYYAEFLAQPIIKKSENCKPITAAYLFVLSDFSLAAKGKYEERNGTAQKIFSVLEGKYLTPSEMSVFDKTIDLFGQVIRGEIRARGDWCFSNDVGDNSIYNLFLCYGDLIKSPHYLDDYENAPISISGIDTMMNFAVKFNPILNMTTAYLEQL